MRRLCSGLFLLAALVAALSPALVLTQAQPRPGAYSTVVTTNTGANSLNVGCAVTSTTCTGGIDAGSLALSSTSAASFDTEGGITAGSGNVGIVDTAGRIPAISSTFFTSLSGANLTGIPETAITDGSLLARMAANEIITASGGWTFGTNAVIGMITFNTPNASNPGLIFTTQGSANGQLVQGNGGAFWDSPGTLTLRTVAGVSRASLSDTGLLTAVGGIVNSGRLVDSSTISPAALTNGTNNDYNPTGFADAYLVRLTSGGASTVLTGLAAQAPGTRKLLCNVGGSVTGLQSGPNSSTDANEFLFTAGSGAYNLTGDDCTEVIYDGTSARWRLIGR